MTLSEYQELAKRTCPNDITGLTTYISKHDKEDFKLNRDKLNLSHMVMGLCSETSELESAIEENDIVNIGEELADKMWYLANYCNFRNITIKKPIDFIITASLVWYESELTDLVKKYVAYNKEIFLPTEQYLVFGILSNIMKICKDYNIDFYKILQNNIDKLRVRYPDKFSNENAINRNLDAERKELEK